ncbi:hypothetical protein SAMN05421755_107712 [Nitrosomonas sp. Nm33]|nr:hypothetical protein SAMN05421755_107712 [Nitrosomonas sp. Nm33]
MKVISTTIAIGMVVIVLNTQVVRISSVVYSIVENTVNEHAQTYKTYAT